MTSWLGDCRYALRQMRLAPGFTAIAVLTLALATGANTALFSLFHALVLRPLPLESTERLVAIITTDERGQETGVPVPLVDALKRESNLFEGVAAYLGGGPFAVSANGMPTVTAGVDCVSGDYYHVVGVRPLFGRLLDTSDVEGTGVPAPAAVLGYRFWQQQFGGDPSVVGRVIHVEGAPFTIAGVTPPEFYGLRVEIAADVTIPISMLPRAIRSLTPGQMITVHAAVARLRDGMRVEHVAERVTTLWPALVADALPSNAPASRRDALQRNRPRIESLATGFSYMRERYTTPLQLLIGLTAWMLLIACVNLAGLLTARAAARDREFATRLALGASRWRLVRLSLTEALLLALTGAVCGLPLAWWSARALALLFSNDYLVPLALDVRPDARILSMSTAVALATGLIFGVIPAWLAGRRHAREALGSARTVARSTTRWGEPLLVGQLALSLVLLVGAAALTQSLAKIRDLDPGFLVEGLHTASLATQPSRGADASPTYVRDLLTAATAVPGVTSAALTDNRPASAFLRTMPVSMAGDTNNEVAGNVDIVSPGFFATMGIPLEDGRDFNWFDDTTRARVAIVSATLAHRLFPDGHALGRRIRAGVDPTRQSMEIVGIVRDASLRDIRQTNPPNVFVALTQESRRTSASELVLRANASSAPTASDVHRAVESLGLQRVRSMRPVDEQIGRLLLRERLMAGFATFFGILAAALASIGIYGLLAFAVRVRTREIGVRLAVGASPRSVLTMVLARGVRLAAIGVALGLPLGLYSSRLLKEYLYDVQPSDPALLVSVAGFVLVLTVAAAYLPARLASRVDPATALRAE